MNANEKLILKGGVYQIVGPGTGQSCQPAIRPGGPLGLRDPKEKKKFALIRVYARLQNGQRSRCNRYMASASSATAWPRKTLSASKARPVSCCAIFFDFSSPTMAG